MRTPVALAFLLALASTEVAAQTTDVAGRVTQAGDVGPLPGVNVVVKGTSVGTTTDGSGAYALAALSPSDTLVFSFVGFIPREEPIAGRSVINVALQEDQVALDELVVVGYGQVRRADLTGSTASVDVQALEELPVTSVEQVLQGRAAGVQVVQNSGAPGGAFTVRIRGGNSMRGGNDPLYVVDGFPVSAGGDEGRSIMSTLSPGDIESIEILKDASATAIYGARGANGVVIITTKRGRAESRVEFESYVGVQEVTNTIPLLNARQYAELANEFAVNEGIADVPFPDLDNLAFDTDWQDEIYRAAPQQNYALRFSGGSATTQYLLSGNYLDQQGIIETSNLTRGTLRFNLTSEITDRFTISNQLMLARTENNEVPVSGDNLNVVHNIFVAPPTVPVYDESGNYYDYSDYFWFGQYPRNPVADVNELTDRRTNLRILESFSAEYRIFEGFTAKTLFGADYLGTQTENYATRLHETGGAGGTASVGRGETSVYLNENTLSYNRTFSSAHRINTTAGFTWQHEQNSGLSASASGFVNDLLGPNALGSGEAISPPGTGTSGWTLVSWLGRLNYVFKDRYLFTLTGRADGSSRFGAGNKWGYFPSAAFAWRLSEEPFLAGSDVLSNAKLRLSWGRTGNQAIGPYQSLQRISDVQLVMGSNLVSGFGPANLANPNLRWEQTDQYNAGVDVGLWDERLYLTFDVYQKNTDDLLALVNLPPSTGFGSILQNVGSIRNTGFELAVGGVPVLTEDLQWAVSANVSANRNEVVEVAQGNEFMAGGITLHGAIHLIREGEPLSVYYGFVEDGLDDEGNIRYVDQNGDGEISDMDRVILGDPYPDLTYGLSTTLNYKGFDLSVLLQGVYGTEIYNANLGYTAASFTRGENQIVDVYENHWSPANPDPNAKYPRLSTSTLFRPSDRFIEDGSYLRLKNVRLGYHVPTRRLGWAGVDDLMIYVSGQNLLTITGYSWYDPEINQFGGSDLRLGVDRFTYPQARTYTLGVRVGL